MTSTNPSSSLPIFRLGKLTRVTVVGKDAIAIVNNVATNDLKKLDDGGGCESFITDVRGKTIGHGFLFRKSDDVVFAGANGQAGKLIAHLNKYTIREDSTPYDVSDQFSAYVLSEWEDAIGQADWQNQVGSFEFQSESISVYRTPITSTDSVCVFVPVTIAEAFEEHVEAVGRKIGNETEFHAARTMHGFPWYGVDITDNNLPQELDRDDRAISFTKGCYLGQETVARLDALGQVQKKWVRIEFQPGHQPDAGMVFEDDGKAVCRITSVTSSSIDESPAINKSPEPIIAHGFARRSHFDVGSTLEGTNRAGEIVSGKVVASAT